MGLHTGIEWAQATWNPWMGCEKVSPGCRFCYAERDMTKYGQDFATVKRSKTTFEDPLKWARGNKLNQGDRIFTCSISDFFIKQADQWRGMAWDIIRRTPQFNYLILTKRIERAEGCLPGDWGTSGYPNVWLGVSAENQQFANKRIPLLLRIPAVVHWVSAEPLLGPINLHFPSESMTERDVWVIAGGESGTNPRPMDPAWAIDIQQQCQKVNVPFFFKQMGGSKQIDGHWGGNLLGGRTWLEIPEKRPA